MRHHINSLARRSVASLTLTCALLFPALTTRAANVVFNYQASQFTGWKDSMSNNINTIGGHVTSATFTDGSADGINYTISALPFGQIGANPNPVYEAAPANATINYQTVLSNAFGTVDNFVYNNAFGNTNEFNIQSYSVFASNGGVVGQDMFVVYNGGAKDPPINAGLHWIQVLWTNWKLVGMTGSPGVVDNKVDNLAAPNPYYDTNGAAGSLSAGTVFNFYDAPGRASTDLQTYNITNKGSLTWMAEDFLVADTGTQTMGKENINVYGGIEYGWQVVPEPASILLAATAAFLGLTARRHRTRPAGPMS